MPLLKLWNSLRSASKKDPARDDDSMPATDRASGSKKNRPQSAEAPNVSSGAHREDRSASDLKDSSSNKQSGGQKRSPRRLSRLLRSDPHSQLTRQIKKVAVQSVLEIGVGDGTRALSVLESIARTHHEDSVHYVAIDLFESGGGIELRTFHKQLRTAGVAANLLPLPAKSGLDRAARTYGQMDLVLIADPTLDGSELALRRVCKPGGLVFRLIDGQWSPFEIDSPNVATKNLKAA